jgi:hypothetical protein
LAAAVTDNLFNIDQKGEWGSFPAWHDVERMSAKEDRFCDDELGAIFFPP